MLCSLCGRDADQVIRVDGWVVCQWCVSNKVLEHAIEVRANLKKLTEVVATTRITHQEDAKRAKEAEARLRAAYGELAAAIQNLATISTESHQSLETSMVAAAKLHGYESSEVEKTRKARKETPQ